MVREAIDVRLRVLKESNKSRFDSYSVRKSALIISYITLDCGMPSFSDNLSQNSCILILGDPGAVSRVDKMFVVKVYCKIETSLQ